MQTDVLVINAHLTEINLLTCGWEDCEPSHAFGPWVRDHFLVHFVLSGKGIYTVGSKTYTLGKGDLFLILPGTSTFYQADADDPWVYSWLGFDGTMAMAMLRLCGFHENQLTRHVPYLRDLFQQIRTAHGMVGGREWFLTGILYTLLSRMAEANSVQAKRPTDQYVPIAVDYMKANYFKDIRIADIAIQLGIDRRYFCRIFTEVLGISPQQYLIEMRMSRATQLLQRQDLPIGEVARSVGYQDLFLFSKMFKKRYGSSPSAYRRRR